MKNLALQSNPAEKLITPGIFTTKAHEGTQRKKKEAWNQKLRAPSAPLWLIISQN
jgi:hypothetical protein